MEQQDRFDRPFSYHARGYSYHIYTRGGTKVAEVKGYLERGREQAHMIVTALNFFFSDENLRRLEDDNERPRLLQKIHEIRERLKGAEEIAFAARRGDVTEESKVLHKMHEERETAERAEELATVIRIRKERQ
jgi:hypothetical protein